MRFIPNPQIVMRVCRRPVLHLPPPPPPPHPSSRLLNTTSPVDTDCPNERSLYALPKANADGTRTMVQMLRAGCNNIKPMLTSTCTVPDVRWCCERGHAGHRTSSSRHLQFQHLPFPFPSSHGCRGRPHRTTSSLRAGREPAASCSTPSLVHATQSSTPFTVDGLLSPTRLPFPAPLPPSPSPYPRPHCSLGRCTHRLFAFQVVQLDGA